MQLGPPAQSPPKQRKWLPVFAVVGVILVVVLGGLVAAASVIEPVTAVQVAPGVSITPAEGWGVAGTGQDPPQVRLTRGSATLDAFVVDAAGSIPTDLLDRYVQEILDPDSSQLEVGEPREVELPSGRTVLAVGYVGVFDGVGSPIEGEVFALPTSDGRAVVFAGWAPQGGLAPAYDEILSMVDGTQMP